MFEVIRDTKKTLIWVIAGKHDDRQLHFTVKADKATSTLDAARLVDLSNALGGGSKITATYNSTSKTTKLEIVILPSNTQTLTGNRLYYCDLESVNNSDSTDKLTYKDELYLIADVRTPSDVSTPATNLRDPGYSKRVEIKITPPSTITESVSAYGFDGTLSYAITGSTLTITSTDSSEFDESFKVIPSVPITNFGYVNGDSSKFQIVLPSTWQNYNDIYLEVLKR